MKGGEREKGAVSRGTERAKKKLSGKKPGKLRRRKQENIKGGGGRNRGTKKEKYRKTSGQQ